MSWVLDRLSVKKWSLLGCLATEERCLGTWEILRGRAADRSSWFIEIDDPESRFTEQSRIAKNAREIDIASIGMPSEGIEHVALLARDSEIVSLIQHFIDIGSPSIILDMSCFPKRFFFPFVKRLLASTTVSDLLVAYTVPLEYHPGNLAEDHEPLAYLPLFGADRFPEPPVDVAFVGVGFTPLGISQLLEPYSQSVPVKLLFPFPPGPPSFERNWKFIGELRKNLPPASVRAPIRVSAYDVPDTFSRIYSESEAGHKYAVFAPYGPKPTSLAMCLAAVSFNSPVLYTQPRAYNPAYSSGVKRSGGGAVSYAYCIRLGGIDYYKS
jgi:hypothetical protein